MRCLVTGASGFIGKHLSHTLHERGDDVVMVDKNDFDPEDLGWVGGIPHKVDFTDNALMVKMMEGKKYDVVFHLGALPRVQFSIDNPLESNFANINGTLSVLDAARQCGVKRFIYSASSSAYGDQDTLPLVETMQPNPMSPYALQKLVGEGYCKLYHDIHGMETVSLRYFNVFGPRQDPGGSYAAFIPKFIDSISKGLTPLIYGDGNQTRDFTYVDDVVRANILAATTENEEAFGDVFNIGAGNRISINEVSTQISDYFGGKVTAAHCSPLIESRDTEADNSKAKKVLGWEPQVSFKDGLDEAIRYAREANENG